MSKQLDLNPNYVEAYRSKGYALYSLERYEEAIEACEQAIRLNPNDAGAYINKSYALYSLRSVIKTYKSGERVIGLDGRLYVEAYRSKGYALYSLERYGGDNRGI